MARSCAFGEAIKEQRPAHIFRRPHIPAAGSECPAFPFTLPSAVTWSERQSRTTAAMVRASMGSPSAVPVPWASTIDKASL
eukprot:scaffold191750_cov31-Tisochrysis_lutea.AAC.1